jgi:hypothetical protein
VNKDKAPPNTMKTALQAWTWDSGEIAGLLNSYKIVGFYPYKVDVIGSSPVAPTT